MKASGISTGFPVLSRSSGQVPHVLLTRSPLSTRASPGFSFDLHVLGAPPAFVLSQDQTLHRDLNPTNNSVEHEIGEPPDRVTSAPFRQLARRPPKEVAVRELMVTSLTRRPHWLLASLFRFQGAVLPDTGAVHPPRGVASLLQSAEPTLTSATTSPAVGGAGEKRPCQSTQNRSPGGLEILRAGRRFCKPGRRIRRRIAAGDAAEPHRALPKANAQRNRPFR
jgi:hypothetical protein